MERRCPPPDLRVETSCGVMHDLTMGKWSDGKGGRRRPPERYAPFYVPGLEQEKKKGRFAPTQTSLTANIYKTPLREKQSPG